MKTLRLFSLLALAGASAAMFNGCSTQAYDTDHYASSVHVEPSHNLLFGIVKTSPGAFTPVEPCAILTTSSDYGAFRDLSGTRVSLFWGAITFTDY